ncbi:uncharacterized protein (TIGR03086 family) [Halopolyspora algeriensis]|uniref:Uncharacterized protein (TIGR03086 family) n=1 Tax=Halopolyspora algeriensis TaxID=1500506 RepID=A0A368W1T2_9ACTN|nr:TIGR03086 family metal-binding protein [Halopolyspora algeriensis]RCW45948.1 uncharacterized protein (TIGR03086 family) [Halopolyspora algeriensis]TQM55361.1 uncharacterized protein (TIGR03086 family) [Halopolyspora algeriensis]
MSRESATAPLIGGVGLLERAVGYTLGSLRLITQEMLPYPTPCREWDLRTLLAHLDESLTALHEGLDTGHVDLGAGGAGGAPATDLVTTVRTRAHLLLGAGARADSDEEISIAGSPLATSILTSTGAVEIAVHGWDISRTCAEHRPIPPPLAEELLELVPLFVTDTDRPARFAAPVDVPPQAGPEEHLIAFLGRNP